VWPGPPAPGGRARRAGCSLPGLFCAGVRFGADPARGARRQV